MRCDMVIESQRSGIECRRRDAEFMPALGLRASILQTNILNGGQSDSLVPQDFHHFVEYQELYLVAKHLADIKYIGTPLKTASGTLAFAFSFPNPMWAAIFTEISRYLGWKPKTETWSVPLGALPRSAVEFLRPIWGDLGQ